MNAKQTADLLAYAAELISEGQLQAAEALRELLPPQGGNIATDHRIRGC